MGSDADTRAELAQILVSYVSGGRLDARAALPAIRALLGAPASMPTRSALRESLRRHELIELEPIAQWLALQDAMDAQRAHRLRRQGQALPPDLEHELARMPLDAPLGWMRRPDIGALISSALWLQRYRDFLTLWRGRVPRTEETVEARWREARAELMETTGAGSPAGRLRLAAALLARPDLAPLELCAALERAAAEWTDEQDADRARAHELLARLPERVSGTVGEETLLDVAHERFEAGADAGERERLLDLVLTWPTQRMLDPLIAMCREPWAQERAALVLTLRFGLFHGLAWDRWLWWLKGQAATLNAENRALAAADPGALLLLWLAGVPAGDSELATLLTERCERRAVAITPASFVKRWKYEIPRDEASVLLSAAPRREARPTPAAERERERPRAPEPHPAAALPPTTSDTPPTPGTPRAPVAARAPRPAFRETQAWRFVTDNWFMVTGILMVLAGAAVLSYFTWDKHWAVRYTIMPVVLGAFTALLARAGDWLERQGSRHADTAAVLRAAAVGLLPANFMLVGLLVDDPQVTQKLLSAPLLAAAYLLIFGALLRRWCRAIHSALEPRLSTALLCLNALVLLRPLGRVWQLTTDQGLAMVVPAGFYAGFLLAGWAILRLASDVLARQRVMERRVPWFVGGTLALTYVQVFVFVHVALRSLPAPTAYAALVILTGGLVHILERHFVAPRKETTPAIEESFLGHGLVLLGVLMGLSDAYMRILTLVLAGGVWLAQATLRARPLHYHIGLTLASLGIVSIGWLPAFPRSWSAALGLAIALALGLTSRLGAAIDRGRLKIAADALQLTVLLLTAVVAALAQWHFRSEPLATAAMLLAVAALYGWRAWREQSARLALAAMAVVALSLPYLGCADMSGRALRGNSLVFGLAIASFLWIALASSRPTPLMRAARSSVLFVYGAMAVAAMALRVVFERQNPTAVLTAHAAIEYLGPLLMAAALVLTAFFSRSLMPSLMAAAIVVVFFPELKVGIEKAVPVVSWGSGFGSSISGLGMVITALLLSRARSLAKLHPGDRFLGKEPFPLLRFDHSLFTIPLVGSAIFLLAKVDTYNVLKHLFTGVPLKTAMALAITGVAWTLLAVHLRRWEGAETTVHFGWMALLAGVYFGQRQLFDNHDVQWTIVTTGLVLQSCEIAYRALIAPRHEWARSLLAEPTRIVLDAASVFSGIGCTIALLAGVDAARLRWLALFASLELVRHALARDSAARGRVFVALGLAVLLAETAPGSGPLLMRLTIDHSLLPTLIAILTVQCVHVACERTDAMYRRLRPLLQPAAAVATLLALGLGLLGLVEASTGTSLSLSHQALLLAALLLAARQHASGPFALLSAVLTYVLLHFTHLQTMTDAHQRLLLLATPWRLGALALALALSGILGRRLDARWPRLMRSPLGSTALAGPALPWLNAPALLTALVAATRHALIPHTDAVQLVAPYLAAAAFLAVRVHWRSAWLPTIGIVLATLGNIDVIRYYAGAALAAHGVSEIERTAAGIGVTLILVHLVRAALRAEGGRRYLGWMGLLSGALALALPAAGYLMRPGVAALTPWRATLVGALGLSAGLAFRRAARAPFAGKRSLVVWSEALYHAGLAVTLWCAALSIPALRHGATVLIAVAAPAVYFWLRSEMTRRAWPVFSRAYGLSSAASVFLTLWLCMDGRSLSALLLPAPEQAWQHLQVNAALMMALGALLLRLAALSWHRSLGDIGGVALIAGSFVSATSWPGLSPLENPHAAAWCGLAIGHFWLALLARRSALRRAFELIADLDQRLWERQRRVFSLAVFGLAQGLVLYAFFDARTPRESFQPLLLASSTLSIHAGLRWGRMVFFGLAAIDAFASLSFDPLSSWRMAALALVTALLGELTRRMDASDTEDARREVLAALRHIWLGAPALLVAVYATAAHTVMPALRADAAQLWTPFLAAATFGVVAVSTRWTPCAACASALVAVGNTHIVRFHLGSVLEAQGLSDAHMISLGILAMLVEATLVRLTVRRARVVVFTNRLTLAGAAVILGLLTLNYFAHPALSQMTPLRFVVSGTAALTAALYFRRAARRPGLGEERYAELNEGLYHFGVAMAVWCAALLVPSLRQPYTALAALGLPAFYFYAHAERERQRAPELSRRYRNSASTLGFILLTLYALRPIFQMVFFPETRILVEHYHVNAALAMALGILLLRLHALGGTEWLVFYGGLALISGGYFGLTAWPGLSPFEAPAAAAWCAVALGHFWTVVSAGRSPFTLLVRQVAGVGDDQWLRLRRIWGLWVMLASQGLVLLGLLSESTDSRQLAPLLVGAASVLVHHGVLRRSLFYIWPAALQCALALHADFVVPSYLPRRQVIAALLMIWALALLARRRWPRFFLLERFGVTATLLAALSMAHVFYHRPQSDIGLWAVAVIALLAALTPRPSARVSSPEEALAVALVLAVPSWLILFSQPLVRAQGLVGAMNVRPLLATLLALFATSVVARLRQDPSPGRAPTSPLLWHQLQDLLRNSGAAIHSVTLVLVSGAALALQLAHYEREYASVDAWLFGALWAGLAAAWFVEGRWRKQALPFLCAEGSLVAMFALARRQLLLTTPFWTYEYDVWVGLAAGLLMTGVKQVADERRREARLPILGPILLLPLVTILWTLTHDLGTDIALVVIGLNSLIFAYYGRERRDSPYNLLAVTGFVSFVLLVFVAKLELQVLHAYVVPVGVGILALLQLFGDRLPSASRNRVRLVAVLAMLGSAGYHVLLDLRYPLLFNITMLLLCLAAMALGSLMRVRLYLVLGFAGVVVDLAVLASRTFLQLERPARMMSIGAFVLLAGAALVGGALYHKTHSDEIETWLAGVRARFGAWE